MQMQMIIVNKPFIFYLKLTFIDEVHLQPCMNIVHLVIDVTHHVIYTLIWVIFI